MAIGLFYLWSLDSHAFSHGATSPAQDRLSAEESVTLLGCAFKKIRMVLILCPSLLYTEELQTLAHHRGHMDKGDPLGQQSSSLARPLHSAILRLLYVNEKCSPQLTHLNAVLEYLRNFRT